MIYAFGGRNFYSFRDAFEVDLRVKPQASERNIFQTDTRGQKANAVTAIFGANASGKTHLLQALGFLQWFIISSAQSKPSEEAWANIAFALTARPDPVTDLFVEFEMDGQHYRYDLKIAPKRVLLESLRVKRSRFATVLHREWKDGDYHLKTRGFGENADQIPQRQNASFVSTALLLENAMARRLDRFFSSCYGNLSALGRTDRHDPQIQNVMETTQFFHENQEHLNWMNRRLASFDLGLHQIAIRKMPFVNRDGKQEHVVLPVGLHCHDGKDHELPLFLESRGTQSLFVLLRYILPVLKSGGLAFIDEFELGLHSHMIPCLVDLFYAPKHNPHGAQLLFSCHADYIIGQLEKYQIQLVEKDEDGASRTYRLDEITGVRNVDNHYAKYHAGAYGGVPAF